MLQMRVSGKPITNIEIHKVELDYLLSHHARTLLWIGPEFVYPIDDDVPTNEERQ